jgi:hypothetical protein
MTLNSAISAVQKHSDLKKVEPRLQFHRLQLGNPTRRHFHLSLHLLQKHPSRLICILQVDMQGLPHRP